MKVWLSPPEAVAPNVVVSHFARSKVSLNEVVWLIKEPIYFYFFIRVSVFFVSKTPPCQLLCITIKDSISANLY